MNKKYKYSLEDIKEAVVKSLSVSDVMRILGIKITGGSHSALIKRIRKENIDTSHFTGSGWNQGSRSTPFGPKKISSETALVENRLNGYREKANVLRRSLIEAGMEYKCNCCGLLPIWNNKPITLQVNHKNSNPYDNRKENLEFLCGNCHIQYTDECIKLRKAERSTTPCECGNEKAKKAKICKECNLKLRLPKYSELSKRTKINWPSVEEMTKLVWEIPTVKLAEKLGVSDNAISKFCKIFGITKPPRGYWAKQI